MAETIEIFTEDTQCVLCKQWSFILNLLNYPYEVVVVTEKNAALKNHIERIYATNDTISYPIVVSINSPTPLNIDSYIDQAVETIRQNLVMGVRTYVFMKKDGTLRTINATLNSSLIPQDKLPKGESKPRVSGNPNVTCFDVDANGWRSFNIFSLMSNDIG